MWWDSSNRISHFFLKFSFNSLVSHTVICTGALPGRCLELVSPLFCCHAVVRRHVVKRSLFSFIPGLASTKQEFFLQGKLQDLSKFVPLRTGNCFFKYFLKGLFFLKRNRCQSSVNDGVSSPRWLMVLPYFSLLIRALVLKLWPTDHLRPAEGLLLESSERRWIPRWWFPCWISAVKSS